MTGRILDVARLRTGTDGAGITTLVVFADCPLKCKFCINYLCHCIDGAYDVPILECEPAELAEILRKDDIYFKMSNGGVTFGGGEPLLHSEFIKEACGFMDPAWKIRIETSMNVPWESVEVLAGLIDEWFIDVKDMNPEIYVKYTEVSQTLMLRNLQQLLEIVPPDKIMVRVPHIPYYNTDADVEASKQKLRDMGITRINEFEYVI